MYFTSKYALITMPETILRYAPTTILGLIALIAGYLYFFYKNKNNNWLKELQKLNPKDRLIAIEMYLNGLGIRIETANMGSNDKLEILTRLIRAKTNKYLITSALCIILCGFATFLIYTNLKVSPLPVEKGMQNLHLDSPVAELKPKPPVAIKKTEYFTVIIELNANDNGALFVDRKPAVIIESLPTFVKIKVPQKNEGCLFQLRNEAGEAICSKTILIQKNLQEISICD